MAKGLLIVLSAPSGCGKTTVLRKVMQQLPGLAFSISYTTRQPRPGEQDGVDYHFVTHQEFEQMRDQEPSGFLEWAAVHGNLYGTARSSVERLRDQGLDVILDIDVQGARQVWTQCEVVSVFIVPPSMEELRRRLQARGTESGENMQVRLANARKELQAVDEYRYIIVNDRLSEAVQGLTSVIVAERCRARRSPSGMPLDLSF